MSESENAEKLDTPKKAWTFEKATVDFRQAKAMEYIAMYLDKIEGHLARIADAAEGRPSKDAEWERSKAIGAALARRP